MGWEWEHWFNVEDQIKNPKQETSLPTKPYPTHQCSSAHLWISIPSVADDVWDITSCFYHFSSFFFVSSGWEVAGLGSVGQLHRHVWRRHSETWPGVLRPLLRWRDLPGSQGGVQAVQWQEVSWYVPYTPRAFLWMRLDFGFWEWLPCPLSEIWTLQRVAI